MPGTPEPPEPPAEKDEVEVPVAEPASVRSPEQVAAERAMGHVSDLLTNLDGAIERAKKGLAELRKADDDATRGQRLALEDALRDLQRVRKRLFQDAYYGGDRLL